MWSRYSSQHVNKIIAEEISSLLPCIHGRFRYHSIVAFLCHVPAKAQGIPPPWPASAGWHRTFPCCVCQHLSSNIITVCDVSCCCLLTFCCLACQPQGSRAYSEIFSPLWNTRANPWSVKVSACHCVAWHCYLELNRGTFNNRARTLLNRWGLIRRQLPVSPSISHWRNKLLVNELLTHLCLHVAC